MFELMSDYFWNCLMILMGAIAIVISFFTHKNQMRIKRNGRMTEATIVSISIEKGIDDSPPLDIPVFRFTHKSENGDKTYRVKGKSNASGKIGEVTPIYYLPENPEKEYYLPKKDFLVKYVMFFVGMFFFCLGTLYMMESLNYATENYFLYLILSLFAGTFLLFIIGQISYHISKK